MKGSGKFGAGILELLIIAVAVMVILRACGVMIPWFWILSPIWMPALLILIWIAVWIPVLKIRGWMEQRKRRKWH